MNTRTLIGLITAISTMAVMTSCKTTNQASSAVVDDTASTPRNTSGFLETSYEPLDDWMNERYEVTYQAMTPKIIFEQVPLSDIHYKTTNLPENVATFNFESSNISRRELLKKIADHWNLKMDYINGSNGEPSAVAVSG